MKRLFLFSKILIFISFLLVINSCENSQQKDTYKAVLSGFPSINLSLEASFNKTRKESNKKFDAISLLSLKNNNFKREQDIAENIFNSTNEVIDNINSFERGLIDYTGGMNKDKIYQNPYDLIKTEEYLLGSKKDGMAYAIKEQLDEYITTLNSLDSRFNFKSVAPDSNEIPELKGSKYANTRVLAIIGMGLFII